MNRMLAPFAALLLICPAVRGAEDAAWVRLKDPLDTATVKAGEMIFANRPYAFESFPKELDGLAFVRGDIESTFAVAVVRDGILRALTAAPETKAAHGQSEALRKLGFGTSCSERRRRIASPSTARP